MPESLSIPGQPHSQHRVPSGRWLHYSTATLIGLGAVLSLAGGLRLYHLDGYGLWSDEFVTLMVVSTESYADLIKLCFKIPQPMPPFYFLLNKAVFDLFSQGEVSLRLLSALSSLLTVYCVFELGRRLINVEIGFFAALLCAVNSTQIVYAQNARPYALCLLLSAISMISFLGWLKDNKRSHQIVYLVSTGLLVYTHYIFAIVPCIQTAHVLLHRSFPALTGSTSGSWFRSWAAIQTCLVLLLLPLLPQLWRVFQDRHSLNWERRIPKLTDSIMFLNLKALGWAMGVTLLIWVGRRLSGFLIRQGSNLRVTRKKPHPSGVEPVSLLFSWYLIPLITFLLIFYYSGLNLFVERYLILCSLPLYLLLPSLAFALCDNSIGRVFLLVYLGIYVLVEPAGFFFQKKEFSQGVPGGSEWREALGKLQQPDFESPLVLFQSPFIESNELNYEGNLMLFNYLSAPLHSFYIKRPIPSFILLPVHWWINNEAHRKFKTKLSRELDSEEEFVLLSTQEFWENFEPWLLGMRDGIQLVHVEKEFRSSGSLGLRKISLRESVH